MTQQAHDRSALDMLQEWDADWAARYRQKSTYPWHGWRYDVTTGCTLHVGTMASRPTR
jgi:hypothetical protein